MELAYKMQNRPVTFSRRRTGPSAAGLTFTMVLCWLQVVLLVQRAEAEAGPLPTLTRAEQVRGLTPAEARLGQRVRLVGAVTYSDPGKGLLFVQDASGGVFVVPRVQTADWPVGRKVEITGVVAEGSHLPFVNQAVLQDLGPGTLPDARSVTFDHLATDAEDGNRVEIRGVVRTANVRSGRTTLEIAADRRRLRATFRDEPASREEAESWVDAEVRVQGVSGVVSQDPSNPVFLEIHVPSLTNLTVEVKSPLQTSLAPVHPIASVSPPEAWVLIHRLRVKGRLGRAPDGAWQLHDVTGAIQVYSTPLLVASSNSFVDVLGFPGGVPTSPVLEDVTVLLPAWRQDASRPADAAPELLLPVLTQAEVVRNLPVSEAQRGYPTWVQGVISYSDPDWNELFIQDQTSGIRIVDPTHRFVDKPGQEVVLEGYSGMGPYAPIIREPRFHVLGVTRLPTAKPVTFEQLKAGQEESQRVEIQGIVRHVTVESGHLAFTISASGGPIRAFIPDVGTNAIPVHLVDAEVQVRGVCDTVVNKDRQWVGLRLLTGELADIQVTKPAPADPFSLPVQPINQPFYFQSHRDLRHRIHVRGSVTFRDPQWCTLFVQDEQGSLYVRTLTAPALELGDRVDVVGFVDLEPYGLVMSEAIYRRLGPGVSPAPTSVTMAQAESGESQSRLISLQARLVGRIHGTAGRGLLLQAAEWTFTALLESTQSAYRLDSIREGSLLRLTGICRLEAGDSHAAKALRLQLRTPEDVIVLKRPPRWTNRQWMAAAGSAGMFLAATVGWVILLRRNVRRQTRAMRTLSECNQALVRTTDEAQFLDKVCHILTGHGGYQMAWIGYAEEDRERTVRPVAQAGFENGYLRTLKITWSDREQGHGPTARAIRTRQPVLTRNPPTYPTVAPGCQPAIERRYAASAALPLVRDDRVLGVLMVYAADPGTFEADEVDLLTELASDLAYGITALRTEQALVASERQYRLLVEHANSIILRWNPEGYITFLNDFGLRFFGYSAEEIFGRPVLDTIVPPTESSGRDLRQLIEQICADPKAFEQNVNENMRRNGERVWIAWTNRIERDAHGQLVEILSVGTDITDRKRAEEAVRELNANLERRVTERTAQLAVARDRAEAADRVKSAFLATMSHELRTPLNSIIGFTGILLQGLAGPINKEQDKQLHMVQGSARHLLALINDVLDISKIEAKQVEIQCVRLDLRESIQRVMQTVAPLAEKKGLVLATEIAPEIGVLTSDRRRLEQILLNLLSNAIKFTAKGRVTLAAEPIDSGRAVQIRVVDTGMGIKPEDLGSLFQPFRQIDTGLARQHEGTGLGLAICKRLVERLGGEIQVESQWGRGSAFRFTLPNQLETKCENPDYRRQ